MRLFALFYFIALFFTWLISLPLFILLPFKQKYKDSIPARFLCFKNSSLPEGGYWFHACSLGETLSLEPILKHIDNPRITTITQTGYAEAKKLSVHARYLPFEIFLPFWMRKHKKLIVLEAELWFMLFFVAKQKGMDTILLNARISERSFPKYLKFSWLYKKIFANIDCVVCQSTEDKIRLEKLGAKNVKVFGNIKSFKMPVVTKSYMKPKEPTITAASTHEGEEAIFLDASLEIINSKLIIAPRHPERFEKVAALVSSFAQKHNKSFSRFSKTGNFEADIVVVDCLGELINIYAISDVVVLGGAFVNSGGHNPIEPAFFGCKLISGVNIFNQYALFGMIEDYKLCEPSHLKDALNAHESLKPCRLQELNAQIERLIGIIKS